MRKIFCLLLCLCMLSLPVRASDTPKYVALTFDDGPSGRFTRTLLEGLEQRNTPATFFLCGYRIREYSQTAELIFDSPHEIGLHGYSHQYMDRMDARTVAAEILDTLSLLPEDRRPRFLRPPGGLTGPELLEAARNAELSVLNWSLDTRDWEITDANAIVQKVLTEIRPGDVILMHDMSDSSVEAALTLIDRLTQKGYTFLTVSELAAAEGLDPKAGTIYCRFS